MGNKINLIIISPFLPYPLTSGGKVRLMHTIQKLCKQFEVSLFAFYEDEEEKIQNIEWLKKQNVKAKLFKTNKRSWNSFIGYGVPYWFSNWYSKSLVDEVKSIKIKQNMPQIIQIETSQLLYLAKYIPKGITSIFTAYDISYISFWRRLMVGKKQLSIVIKFFLWLEILAYEKKYLRVFDMVVCVSNTDKQILSEKFCLKNVITIPNGVESVNLLSFNTNVRSINLGYIGSFEHSPNRKAVEFFITRIAPELEKQGVDYYFYITGENIPGEITEMVEKSMLVSKSSIINLGYLENSREFYSKIDTLICPIFSGSGTRIKILESLSFGRPVITSKIGAEGIDIINPYLNIINDINDISSWVKAILRITDLKTTNHTNDLQKQLGKYTWSKIFTEYSKRCLSLIN